ncbi:hypothetical protein Tco_0835868, partial [Tanacetum coccineum]
MVVKEIISRLLEEENVGIGGLSTVIEIEEGIRMKKVRVVVMV